MFRKLRVKNFRSIKDSGNLELGNLNIIVGPNNAGKSSLLYALLMLKQTLEDKNSRAMLVTSGPHVDLGSYLDIIRGQDPKQKLSLEFELADKPISRWRLAGMPSLVEKHYRPFTRYKLLFGFDPATNQVRIEAFDAVDPDSKGALRGVRNNEEWDVKGIPPELEPHAVVGFDHFLPFIGVHGKPPKDQKIIELGIAVTLASSKQAETVREMFGRILYVGPVRERIARYEVVGTMRHSESGPFGENLMQLLSGATGRMAGGRTVISELKSWLEKKFKLLKNVRIVDIDKGKTVKAIIADAPRGAKNVNLASMGAGISQMVPVIVRTILTPKRGCLLIEQPEIHLHPAAQADLGDFFIDYAKKERQLIVETHSEHLLLRVRRRIAEKKISPELVRIFLVEKPGANTKIQTLRLAKNGHFERWPKGFFEEGYREAMAIAEAQI